MASIDFGFYQLLTAGCYEMKDRSDFHSLVHYEHHALHHMFPTIDHKLLYHFDNALIEACREFNVLYLATRCVDDPNQTRWSKRRQLLLREGIIGAFEIVSDSSVSI
jgi:fatty acid desaturase